MKAMLILISLQVVRLKTINNQDGRTKVRSFFDNEREGILV